MYNLPESVRGSKLISICLANPAQRKRENIVQLISGRHDSKRNTSPFSEKERMHANPPPSQAPWCIISIDWFGSPLHKKYPLQPQIVTIALFSVEFLGFEW